MDQLDCVVIGAGVVGLAIARALALQGREVVVLEKAKLIGSETSSHNSEVIHAGIYYAAESLKARFCVEGRKRLYPFMEERGIEHKKCGKLIVATNAAQIAELGDIKKRAERNGVDDLRFVEKTELAQMEPALRAEAALLSPSTGILDGHGLMLAYQGDMEDRGGAIAFGSSVDTMEAQDDGIILNISGDTKMVIKAKTVANSAGFSAPLLAANTKGLTPAHQPTAYYAKGNYFTLAGRVPFSKLIYPVPEKAGLGVHLTLDLGGQARFGPDVEWVDTPDYAVDPKRGESFYEAIRNYWPDLKDGSLQPGYAGIRPKLQAPGEPAHDFRIDGPSTHGLPGLVNLFGIESPGLTASLAIGDYVADQLRD
ncbi:NAD(P)/FAD-dependent oxidoreductase [Parvibaculaceae bacterium PLY_AMNH_Bact1]|nr:NAD(P)/FAD-dependent oxidoreductase [Parvibaculaceae bacterium PLY_AMNH_Bact1]